MRVPLAWSGDVTELARALSAAEAWCWLDGAGDDAGGNWSYLGIADELISAEPGKERDFLSRLKASGGRTSTASAGSVAEGFSGGWVTAFGYEFGVALLGVEPAVDAAAPAFALRLDVVIAFDHKRGVAEFRGRDEAAIEAWSVKVTTLLDAAASEPRKTSAMSLDPKWRRSPEEYWREVEACRAAIAEGEAYVLCLTDTATAHSGPVDPLDLYLKLRESGPALRGGVIVAGDRSLVSASPERLLSLRGAKLSTHPIKGTRPRFLNDDDDAAAIAELEHDPKERAENLMIVDLMRNDLSRVCVPGTVGVTGFLQVETHPHVHQLVSTVSGRMSPEYDVFDALVACFPGGSMTGAPKRRAVEILAELEVEPRGLYSGCFGWIDHRGDTELAMTIRSIELRSIRRKKERSTLEAEGEAMNTLALVGAGGGITIDSDPGREHAEKGLKAAPLLAALEGEAAS